jgi:D-serine dehydratase
MVSMPGRKARPRRRAAASGWLVFLELLLRPMKLNLSELESTPLAPTFKGLPPKAVGQPLSALGSLQLDLLAGDLPWPVAVVKDSAMAHNRQWMRDFTARAGVSLCPHGKTTMAPQLFQLQLDDGAWGLTAATASHVRTYRHFGAQRVVLANQLMGRANIDLIFDELEADASFDFYALVDSMASLAELQRALQRRPLARPLQVLLEVGTPGGRTGVRDTAEGIALGRAVREAAPAIALRGVETFEGVFGGDDPHGVELAVHTMMDTIAALAEAGCREGWFAPGQVLLTAGGSQFFDIAAQVLAAVKTSRELHVVLRSGCYLTHDSLHYARMQTRMRQRAGDLWGKGPALRNALEVWAPVQSVPEPTRAICALGKRDLSYDLELPQAIWWFRPGTHSAPQPTSATLRVVALNDQHAYVDSQDGPVPWMVGDLVAFGVGHPCTTFDKWPLLYTVDDHYRVTGGIRTFF